MGKTFNQSGAALAALSRKSAGPMRHRLQPRGGARRENYEDECLEEGGEDEPMFFDLAAEG